MAINKLIKNDLNKNVCRVSYVNSGESSWHMSGNTPVVGNDYIDRFRARRAFSGEDFNYTSNKAVEDFD